MAGHPQLYDVHGKTVILGRQLGAGGEGAVFDVHGAPQFAAKWYKHLPPSDKANKLIGMAHGSDSSLKEIAAWPTVTLHKNPGGPLVGFLMPKLSGYLPIHILYSPANRKFSFPKADWAFLIHAARNLASAVAEIHAHGHVIGDINQGNVLVAENATVKLIDCDSFQIRVNGRNFLCEVGVPEFTPPELHGTKMFAGLTRTTNHDAFGLAVLIFHLIFMGRHPFAGRFLGRGDKPIEDAIKEHRFAFGQLASSKQMAPPPHSLSLIQTSAEVAVFFERAFSESGARGARPTAKEWLTLLDQFRKELVTCTVAPAHKYHRSLKTCPWCNIQRNAGPDFFISITLATTAISATTFDLIKAWAAITAVTQPDATALVMPTFSANPAPNPLPPYLGFSKTQALCMGVGAFVIAAAVVIGLPMVISLALTCGLLGVYNYAPNNQERRKRRAAVKALEKSVQAKLDEWSSLAKNFQQQFVAKLKMMEDSKNRYESFSNARQQELDQLEQARRAEQQKDFLERHFIKDYKIDGIGQGRRATLLSYGIETFYDVTRQSIDQVPGFGSSLTSALLTCRHRIESQFRFDPNKGVNPAAIAAIDHKYALQRVPIEKLLLVGPQELEQIRTGCTNQRAAFRQEAIRMTKMLSEAKVDAAVVNKDPWAIIVVLVLVLGFVFRLGLERIKPPQNTEMTEQIIEVPEIESHTEAPIEKNDTTNRAGLQKPPAQGHESPKTVTSNVASPQQAKPVGNLRRGRDSVLAMLGQARFNGGLENEAEIDSTRAGIEALARPPRGDGETARRLHQDGLASLNRGDLRDAISKLNLAYATDPSDVEIAANLGYAYLRVRDLHQADTYLIYSIALAPARSSSWVRLGQLFAAKEDLELTEAALSHAVRFSDNRPKTRLFLMQLATSSQGSILDRAIRNVLELPFPGFAVTESPVTSTRPDQ